MNDASFDAWGRNYGALRSKPEGQVLKEFRSFAKQQYPEAERSLGRARALLWVVAIFFGLAGMFFLLIFLFVVVMVVFSGTGVGPVIGWAALAILTVGGLGGLLWFAIFALRKRGPHAAWFKMYWFAQQNGYGFTPFMRNTYYPGMMFNLGGDRYTANRIHSAPGQRFFDIGNLSYTTGTGRQQRITTWFYIAMQLDRRLPHIVLDSRQNNGGPLGIGGQRLPISLAADQRLSLEGDFDRYFTLYCPKEYERDALYVLTPDLMALLIDNAAPFDVEIVDDVLFAYAHGAISMDLEHVARRAFQIIDTVGAQTLRQTMRYADDHVGNPALNVVAPQGQRLRQRWWPVWLAAVITGLVIAVQIIAGIVSTGVKLLP